MPVADDLVNREFTAEAPNRLCLTDITEHRTAEGKLHLCAVKDVFSNRFVGCAIDRGMKSILAVAALEDAVARPGRAAVVGCVAHSDLGSQFRSRKYQHTSESHRWPGSMDRVGAAGDNAAMESFFFTLQKNVLYSQRCQTPAQLRRRIIHWIERTYHRRRQRRLGKLTPVEYETVYSQGVVGGGGGVKLGVVRTFSRAVKARKSLSGRPGTDPSVATDRPSRRVRRGRPSSWHQ